MKEIIKDFLIWCFSLIKTIFLYFISLFFSLVIVMLHPNTSTIRPDGTETMKDSYAILILVLPVVISILFYRHQRKDAARQAEEAAVQEPVPPPYAKCEEPKSISPAPKQTSSSDRYIVLDIETTGFSRTSSQIIEIAANKYQDGQLISRFHTFVNPGIPIPPNITRLTGIRDSDVAKAPTLKKIKRELLDFLNGTALVGHNIKSFDIPFLEEKLKMKFDNPIYDTLAMAKCAFPGLSSYKLSYLNEHLNLGGSEYHRAASDVEITNCLYLACKAPEKYKPVLQKQLVDTLSAVFEKNEASQPSGKQTGLTGKNICFTGEISVSRESARRMAAAAGATVKSCVSKKLDYLVVGIQDKRLVGETGKSNAQRQAAELIEKGNTRLKIINESEFMNLMKPVETSDCQ